MLLATAVAGLAGTGCGDDDGGSAVGVLGQAGEGGTLSWALAERPDSLDPLFATSSAERLVSRQIYEPLAAHVTGPFEERRRVNGLVRSMDASAGGRIWRLRLRPGVGFQDGAPFNAAAVLANVDRWQSLPARSGVPPPPEVLADSPKPDLVRFILPAADPGFARALASPRLGVVSPRALDGLGLGELDPEAAAASGTGPFELRERSRDRLLLARNTEWWGSDRGLGPAIEQLELTVVADADERLHGLAAGDFEVAGELDSGELRTVRDDPLLTVVLEPGPIGLGIERSVRGIPAGKGAPPLNAVWLTTID